MQNQEFSEEYYKMKYLKYKAKYEQLKENIVTNGGFSFSELSKANKQYNKNTKTKSKSNTKSATPKAAPTPTPVPATNKKSEIKNLMNSVFEFATKDIKSDTKKVIKIAARLEKPCSYKELINIITDTQNGDVNTKDKLIKSIKKECSTFLGGLNDICKYEGSV